VTAADRRRGAVTNHEKIGSRLFPAGNLGYINSEEAADQSTTGMV
jgi:hypothetical protein